MNISQISVETIASVNVHIYIYIGKVLRKLSYIDAGWDPG